MVLIINKTMKKKKYILSPNCNVITEFENQYNSVSTCMEIDALKKGELFILEREYNYYLINPTIKLFLDFFKEENTLSKAVSYFSKAAKCKKKLIKPTLKDFLTTMIKRRVIIPFEENTQKTTVLHKARFKPKDQILSYQIEEKIFENKKIEIYKANCSKRKIKVAIKILKSKLANKERSVKSFKQEFILLEELGKHPNICQLIEFVQNEETIFGALEFIDGFHLRSFLKKNKASLFFRLDLIDQFFSGMAFIHRRQLLHGDLHMSNVMISHHGNLKIIDFNMSNRKNIEANEIVRQGGVYQYIAPEKLDARAFKMVNAPADFPSEVYQMGVICYYILYDEMPFSGFTWKELANNILYQQPKLEAHTKNGELIYDKLIPFLRRMLSKDPKKRYKTAGHVRQQWKRLMNIKNKEMIKR
ncbi:MAG TPA: serine/threonine protein kinase [Candidatus Moranbacteria bacterium]|nr:serine/threonine protein kinase [Candidatus Moranbacteria bacterium]